ncbi:hypothetical protein [Streptomyces sp. NPDC094049]|uniref:hypothetical protein n=1 Tax=Streptomyces sp. NPDC094049 TaxID=3154987 RepID=UPI003328CC95
MAQPVPQVRKDELQKILDSGYSARLSVSAGEGSGCDQLQAEMDAFYAQSFSDPAAGAMYMSLFFQALIQGCGFLWSNDYHVDPNDGATFQLQNLAGKNQAQGLKTVLKEVDGAPWLYTNSEDRYETGSPVEGADVFNLFHLAPAGFTAADGRPASYLMVDDGRWAGMAITHVEHTAADGTPWGLVAREVDPATTGTFTIDEGGHTAADGGPGSNQAKGSFVRYFPAKGTDKLGILNNPGNNHDTPMGLQDIEYWATEIWHFRPADYDR